VDTPSLEEVAAHRAAFLANHPEAAGRITYITDTFLKDYMMVATAANRHHGGDLEELTWTEARARARTMEIHAPDEDGDEDDPLPVSVRLTKAEGELEQTQRAIGRKDTEITELKEELAKCYRLIAHLRREIGDS
jgi:hypothetical protein